MSSSSGSKRIRHQWDRPVWIPLDSYISQHWSHMRDLDYFVEYDGLSFESVSESVIVLPGEVQCQFGIKLDVEKFLEVDEQQRVSAFGYKYHAMIGNPPSPIFRYDNAHLYVREGYPDEFHKHLFDPVMGEELPGSPEWIGIKNWPTLRQALEELCDWWLETGQHLRRTDE
jgi:hypothetical protein